jgi:hypothetical protein
MALLRLVLIIVYLRAVKLSELVVLLLQSKWFRFCDWTNTQSRPDAHALCSLAQVTYVLEGGWHHKDSQGNEGNLNKGWVQWMTAGSGVIHRCVDRNVTWAMHEAVANQPAGWQCSR